jgi:hypothetical protein
MFGHRTEVQRCKSVDGLTSAPLAANLMLGVVCQTILNENILKIIANKFVCENICIIFAL